VHAWKKSRDKLGICFLTKYCINISHIFLLYSINWCAVNQVPEKLKLSAFIMSKCQNSDTAGQLAQEPTTTVCEMTDNDYCQHYFLELSSKLMISRSFSLRFSSWRRLRLLRASFTFWRRASAWSLHRPRTHTVLRGVSCALWQHVTVYFIHSRTSVISILKKILFQF